jgi:hypothetical protein
MSMSVVAMTEKRAKAIVAIVVEARKKWGRYASPPVSSSELMDALVFLSDNPPVPEDMTPPEEVTKLKRQLAACQNREKARKGGGLPPEGIPTADETSIPQEVKTE